MTNDTENLSVEKFEQLVDSVTVSSFLSKTYFQTTITFSLDFHPFLLILF